MASYSTLKIYLQPYVAKYLESISRLRKHLRQGVDDLPEDAVYFDNKSKEGKCLLALLEAGTKKPSPQYRMNTPIEITVCDKYRPEFDSRYEFITMSDASCKLLNDMIKDLIFVKLHFYVVGREKGAKEMDAIRAFLRFHGINEDVLQFESAKKWFYRARKDVESIDLSMSQAY